MIKRGLFSGLLAATKIKCLNGKFLLLLLLIYVAVLVAVFVQKEQAEDAANSPEERHYATLKFSKRKYIISRFILSSFELLVF